MAFRLLAVTTWALRASREAHPKSVLRATNHKGCSLGARSQFFVALDLHFNMKVSQLAALLRKSWFSSAFATATGLQQNFSSCFELWSGAFRLFNFNKKTEVKLKRNSVENSTKKCNRNGRTLKKIWALRSGSSKSVTPKSQILLCFNVFYIVMRRILKDYR